MGNMTNISKILLASTALMALAGCGGGQVAVQAVPAPAAPASVPFVTATAGTSLALTARQGLEAFTITNGAAVGAGTAVPTGSLQANPTGSILVNVNGFNLNTPSGRTVTYVTTAGSANITGTAAAGTLTYENVAVGGTGFTETTLTNGRASTLTYSTYGVWVESNVATTIPQQVGTLATGVITTAMPTTGTGTFSGNISGFVLTSSDVGRITSGTVSLAANFAGNSVTGSVTGITTAGIDGGSAGTMTDITLSGGAISGATFNGIAATTLPNPAATFNLAGATGTFGGKFYGPSAAEAAGSIAMTGGGATMFAAFGTKR